MAEFPALPLFTDAYLGDTRHLTAAQHGAYLLLLMTAWRTKENALPDDDEKLAAWASMDRRTWLKNKPTVMALWKMIDGLWHQQRLDDERKRAAYVRERQVQGGLATALKRNKTNLRHLPAHHSAEHMPPSPSPSPSPSFKKEPPTPLDQKPVNSKKTSGNKNTVNLLTKQLEEEFNNFWEIWKPFDMDKGSKLKSRSSFDKARKEVAYETIISSCKRYIEFCHSKQQRTQHATTWLNQHGWENEYPAPSSAQGQASNGKPNYADSISRAADNARDLIRESSRIRAEGSDE